MSYYPKAARGGLDQDEQTGRVQIKITLVSTDLTNLNKFMLNIYKSSHDYDMVLKGPAYLPTRRLAITTRKSPCGEGTNTWDRFEMRLHKRIISLVASPKEFKRLMTPIAVPTGVEVKISVQAPAAPRIEPVPGSVKVR